MNGETTCVPLGPPTPKKPKPKAVKFMGDLYGYIDSDADITGGTEIYAVDANSEFQLVETGTYQLESGPVIQIIEGVIQ